MTDDPRRWTEVRDHFHALLDLEPDARASELAELARVDPMLAREVAQLLEHVEGGTEAFEDELLAVPAASLHEAIAAHGGADPDGPLLGETWQNLDVPHRFFGNHLIDDPEAAVTIEPGTVLEFASAGLRVNAGTLRAIGEEGDSIIFTRTSTCTATHASPSPTPPSGRAAGMASTSTIMAVSLILAACTDEIGITPPDPQYAVGPASQQFIITTTEDTL